MNVEFFELLYADKDFCAAVGRMTLAAGRFESALKEFLALSGVAFKSDQATLGSVIALLEKNRLLSENGVTVLRDLKRQRNYLTHSLFDLFAGRIDETVLPRTHLIPLDVDVFTEKARVLMDNFAGLTMIAERRIDELAGRSAIQPDGDQLLFRP